MWLDDDDVRARFASSHYEVNRRGQSENINILCDTCYKMIQGGQDKIRDVCHDYLIPPQLESPEDRQLVSTITRTPYVGGVFDDKVLTPPEQLMLATVKVATDVVRTAVQSTHYPTMVGTMLVW